MNKHEKLGDLIKILVANKCYTTTIQRGENVMSVQIFDDEDGIIDGAPRWDVISYENTDYLIVEGDITFSGTAMVTTNVMEIVSMYKDWLENGKPSKIFTHRWGFGEMNPYLMKETKDEDINKRAQVTFEDFNESDE